MQSVERAISILLSLDANSPTLDAATLSTRTGLSRSTVYRLLATLEQTGMVRKRGSRFELGPNVMKLAGGFRAANHISVHAKSVLVELAEQVHTGVALAVLDGDVVVTVETGNAANGDYVMQPHEIGRRIPATATSVGRMLLAFHENPAGDGSDRTAVDAHHAVETEQIRRQGYALTSGLLEAGVRTIAVPVYDQAGAVVAGLSILSDVNRTSVDELAGHHLARARAAAERLMQLTDWEPSAIN
ncbi:MAG: helix-turn-helix domain-containing protein [Actinobacteria bacterium]|nr:helix-turn-helix domain-containing protein [Actinomycetota bacterium]